MSILFQKELKNLQRNRNGGTYNFLLRIQRKN